MHALHPLLSAFVPLWALTAVGYLVGRTGLLGRDAEDVLGRFVFHVAMPAALFGMLSRTPLGSFANTSMLAFAAGTALALSLGAAAARWLFRRRPAEQVVGGLAAGYVNAGNLGIPVAAQVLGDASFVAPVLLFQLLLVTPLMLALVGAGRDGEREQTGHGGGRERAGRDGGREAQAGRVGVRERAGGVGVRKRAGRDGTGARVARSLAATLRNPIVLAAALGAVFSAAGWRLPGALGGSCDLLGRAGVPTALVVLGLSLHGRRPDAGTGARAELGVAVAVKTLVQPASAYAMGRFALHLTPHQLLTVVVCSALPTAQNVFVYAREYGAGAELARNTVVVSTLVSMGTLSGFALLLMPGR
ncbi:AEC family transporter [Streptomyces sp. I05A-00742]|uniref:AEC family transporter n=1 Tax=Streptomyces sp. I05A-00742 TaxID=2732853 RepID=UPI0014897CC8|nr:AEC family transporter [Streptomyces sp. I05A-00742]